MGKKDIVALLNLAYRLFIHILKKPIKWITGYNGYNRFVEQYKGLKPVTGDLRAVYPSLSGCINCGICVAECKAIKHEVAPVYFYIRYSKLLPELFYSEHLINACLDCDTCLVHCPTGLQIKALVLLYTEMKS
ncbi:MAG: 4Fe-4S dicluster domain-containing protein [bacterium]